MLNLIITYRDQGPYKKLKAKFKNIQVLFFEETRLFKNISRDSNK